jgi:hypothetical protein
MLTEATSLLSLKSSDDLFSCLRLMHIHLSCSFYGHASYETLETIAESVTKCDIVTTSNVYSNVIRHTSLQQGIVRTKIAIDLENLPVHISHCQERKHIHTCSLSATAAVYHPARYALERQCRVRRKHLRHIGRGARLHDADQGLAGRRRGH